MLNYPALAEDSAAGIIEGEGNTVTCCASNSPVSSGSSVMFDTVYKSSSSLL